MAVPAHDERDFEFAKKYDIPITEVVTPIFGEKHPKENKLAGISCVIFDPNKFDEKENELFVNGVRDAGKVYNALYFGSVDSTKWRYKMTSEPKGFEWQKIAIDDFPQKLLKQYPIMDRMENKFIDLINAGKSAGHANFDPDIDGSIRYIPLGRSFNGKFYPAMSFRAVYDVIGGEKITTMMPLVF